MVTSVATEYWNELLVEMLRTEYINAAFVVDRQGYLLAQRIRQLTSDRAALVAQTLAVQGAIHCFGLQTGLGPSHQLMLEFKEGVVMMAPLDSQETLVVIATSSVTLGLFRTLFGGFLQRFNKQIALRKSEAEGVLS